MFRVNEIDSWLDFEKMMHDRLIADARDVHYRYYYRGQSNASWPLATTLERFVSSNLSVSAYYSLIQKIRPTLETFTDQRWDLPDQDEFISGIGGDPVDIPEQASEYMGYLRHFGFPSPFLDWTLSPFIAAYFAFREVASPAKSVAIFEYLEAADVMNDFPREYPQIFPVFAASRNNKRYYLQQSAMTVCLWSDGVNTYFAPHENPRSLAEDSEVIDKYILPASQRAEALQSLEAYNINAFSLIGTNESLLETLFLGAYQAASRAGSYFGDMTVDDRWSL